MWSEPELGTWGGVGVGEPARRPQVGSTTPLLTLRLHTLLQIKV